MMPSKIEALVRNFQKTDGEALCLVPGEKIFIIRAGAKVIVGREDLSRESFQAVAEELVPGADEEALADMKHRVPYQVDAASSQVEIVFGRSGATPALMVRRPGVEVQTAPTPPAYVPPPPPPPLPKLAPKIVAPSAS